MKSSRRHFIKASSILAAASALPARWLRGDALPADRKLKLRFAMASDLHYGQKQTPYAQMADDLVDWINLEKQTKGLDMLFLNGDLTNDSTQALLDLRDKHLSKLEVPYYTTKGNHDFVDEKPGSPTESWKKIWGHAAKGYRIVEVDEEHRMVTYQVNAEQGGELNRNLLPG